jgi:hypothetical protein
MPSLRGGEGDEAIHRADPWIALLRSQWSPAPDERQPTPHPIDYF